MAILLVVICLIMLLTGCHKTLDHGIVIDKQFSPAHRTYSPMILHINKSIRIIPRWVSHPNSWSIWVQDGEDKDCWEVSKEYFESVEIGEYIDMKK